MVASVDAGTLRRVVVEAAERSAEVRKVVTAALGAAPQKRSAPRSELSTRLIGQCPAMEAVRDAIGQIAGTNMPVLITGESGTGKDLVAQEIHEHSRAANGSFIPVNCGAIPGTLITSELFGHERGSFTGAVSRQIGQVELANNGTLFLDEIGELPCDVQATLLRFLQDLKIRRVGGNREITVDCRIVAATNADLQEAVATGRFRQDLFFRLDVFPIHLPPLRERGDDVLLLAEVFLDRIAMELHRPPITLSRDARSAIRSYHWPGNVRELSSKLKKAVILCDGSWLRSEDLRFLATAESNSQASPKRRGPKGRNFEPEEVALALRRNGGNVTASSRDLGVSRVTLYKLISRYGLNRG